MTLLLFFTGWLDKRSDEKKAQREHELRLKELENEEIHDSRICQSCEALKLELHKAHALNYELIQKMTNPTPITVKPESNEEPLKPILPNHRSWKVRQQTLEANDRHNARIIQDKVKEEVDILNRNKPVPEIVVLTEPITVESIEKELGVTDANESISKAS
jgi:hypothetical protein